MKTFFSIIPKPLGTTELKPLFSLLILYLLFEVAAAQGVQKGETDGPTLVIRQGHRDVINEVIYTPGGQFVISAGQDQMIKIWDVNTGMDVRTLKGHKAAVKCLEITADGRTLLSGDDSGMILQWNLEAEESLEHEIEAHEPSTSVNVIRLLPDESSFMSGGEEKVINHWSLQDHTLIKTIEGLTGEVRSIGFSPDGKRLMMGAQRSNDVELLLIDAESGVILDDALKHIKGAGAAKVFTAAILTPLAVASSIGKGDVNKDMLTYYVFDYSNIQFKDDGKTVLVSQNLYLPLTAAKGEEDKTGGSSIAILELTDDRNQFKDAKEFKRWALDYPKTRAIYNDDQTKIIANVKNAIRIYDMETADFPTDQKEAMQYEPPVLQEFTTNVGWLTSIAMAPDNRTVVSSDESRNLTLWDIHSGRRIRNLEGYVQPALAVDVMPDGEHIVVGSSGKNMVIWNITTGQITRAFDRSYTVNGIDISTDGKYMVTTSPDTRFFKLWNINTGNIIATFTEKSQNIKWARFDSEDENYILAATEEDKVRRWSVRDKKSKDVKGAVDHDIGVSHSGRHVRINGNSFQVMSDAVRHMEDVQSGAITDAVFTPDGSRLITTNDMGEVCLYDLQSGRKMVSMALIDDFDFIAWTPDFYYTSSKGAAKALAFRSGKQIVPFEQVELQYNRPDLVAERLGYASERLIASFKAAYQKRISRLGFSIDDLHADIYVPELDVNVRDLPLATDQQAFSFTVRAQDSRSELVRLKVFVNNVPALGLAGMDIPSTSDLIKDVTVQLSAGLNEIRVSVLNQNGLESLPETFEVNYDIQYTPRLFIAAIGVSEYSDPNINDLKFAAKDAHDIVAAFKESRAFGDIRFKTMTEQEATPANILQLPDFFAEAGIDDVVILFIAGHGVLDANYDYYFATHQMDFSNPASGGVPYSEFERILGEVKSRKKLLFMDTCHAGELDKADVEIGEDSPSDGPVSFRSIGPRVQYKEDAFGLSNTLELSKSLFGDLKTRTGATVIAAAGGAERAREDSGNGLFTFSLLEGIKTRRVDLNRDRNYTVSEFSTYIIQRVIDLSGGQQVPTSREENLRNDFRIY